MQSWIIISAIAVAAVAVAPYALPSSKTVERVATIKAPVDKVFSLIASREGYQRFNPYKVKDPDLKITMHGPSSGIGSGFAFDGKDGKGTQTIVALEENRSVTMQIDLGAMGRPVTTFLLEPSSGLHEPSSGLLEPSSGTTIVTWSTKSDFGMNPIGRVFGLFLDGMLGPDYETGLRKLAQAFQAV